MLPFLILPVYIAALSNMTSDNAPQTHQVTKANIAFLQDNPAFATEKPYLYLLPPSPDFPVTNCFFASHLQTPLLDCRCPGYRNDLQGNGFAFLHRPLRQKTLGSTVVGVDATLIDHPSDELLAYLDDMRAMAKDYIEADRVIVFDWRVSWHGEQI